MVLCGGPLTCRKPAIGIAVLTLAGSSHPLLCHCSVIRFPALVILVADFSPRKQLRPSVRTGRNWNGRQARVVEQPVLLVQSNDSAGALVRGCSGRNRAEGIWVQHIKRPWGESVERPSPVDVQRSHDKGTRLVTNHPDAKVITVAWSDLTSQKSVTLFEATKPDIA